MTTTAAIQQPPNHGRKWTHDEDRQISDAPDVIDDHFATTLGRSPHAVQSRRAVIAARMHKTTGNPIEECAAQLGTSSSRVALILSAEGERANNNTNNRTQKGERKKTLFVNADFNNTNNHHHFRERPATASSFTSRTSAPPHTSILRRPQQQPSSAIGLICSLIKRGGGGSMHEIWTQEALVPTMVQYHNGFQAYAAFVKGGGGGR
jgi:hypothetical protein